jgi:hypothetical protein
VLAREIDERPATWAEIDAALETLLDDALARASAGGEEREAEPLMRIIEWACYLSALALAAWVMVHAALRHLG